MPEATESVESEKTSSLLDKLTQKHEQTDKAATVMDKWAEKEETQVSNEPSDKAETVFSKLAEQEEQPTPEPVAEVPKPVTEVVVEKAEKIAEEVEVETPEVATPVAEVPTETEIPITIEETPAPAPSEAPVSILDKFKEKLGEKPAETTATQQPATGPRTIADSFNKSEPAAAPMVDGKPIKPDEIPIHKQYQYVQKVFGGNNVRFRIIVDKINNSKDANEVEEILTKYVFGNSEINKEDATVKEFAALMRSRF